MTTDPPTDDTPTCARRDHQFERTDLEVNHPYVYISGYCDICGATMVRGYRYEETEIHE